MDNLERISTNPRSLGRTRERVAMLTESARRGASYVAHSRLRRVFPDDAAVDALSAFRRPLQDEERPALEVLRELDELGSPATVVQHAGRYFGFVNGGVDPAASAASVLAGAWDQNGALPAMSPTASTLDEVAGGWVKDLLGLPASAAAGFCSGATIANLTGALAARDALLRRAGWDPAERGLFGAPPLRVVVGAEAHSAALKALRLAGFGLAELEVVPTDATGAIDADQFPTDLDDRTLVVLQAGNVNTGASDPFAAIIPSAKRQGAWVHVDGAFGLWAAASRRRRAEVAGVELADSWAVDAHKWLNVPYDSALAIVRDPVDLARAMSADGAYLELNGGHASMQIGIQMSQRARGVETWAALASRGRDGVADLIDGTSDRAQQFGEELARAGATLLAPVVLNQALVAFGTSPSGEPDDAMTDAVVSGIQAEGTLWAGGTTWKGRRGMRLSVSDAATTSDDVAACVSTIVRVWEELRADR